MIRKVIIVMLTLGAVVTGILGVRSYMVAIRKEVRIGDIDRIYFHLNDGYVRVFWFRSDQEFQILAVPWVGELDSYAEGPPASLARGLPEERLYLMPADKSCSYPITTLVSAEGLRSYGLGTHQVLWPHVWPPSSGTCPGIQRSVVRTRAWTVFVVLAAYPAIAFIRGPVRRWRRRWKGLCIACGYDLRGNVTGVCSECGAGID